MAKMRYHGTVTAQAVFELWRSGQVTLEEAAGEDSPRALAGLYRAYKAGEVLSFEPCDNWDPINGCGGHPVNEEHVL